MGHLCRELNIAYFVNHMLRWDEKQWNASPGSLIVGMIINILVNRVPLYRVERFFEGMDVPLLFDEDLQAHHFNDDALGRALDRLAEADPKQLISTVACRAARVDDMEIRSVHADTTSLSVHGDYTPKETPIDETGKKYIEIVHGHSKDHRPDLKQFKFGLVVTRDGLPVIGNVTSGNENDGVWNKEILKEFEVSFLDYWKVIYVADSSLVTTENLDAMHAKGVRLISLLPGRYNLGDELRDKAWEQGNWVYRGALADGKNAAEYWTQSMEAELAGRTYRFVVVRSSNLDKRKEKKLKNLLKGEKQTLEKLEKAVSKEVYQCSPDAESRLQELLSNHKMLHGLTGQVVELVTETRPPGRPKKDSQPEKHVTYHIQLQIHEPTEERLHEWRQREATFVLITTESDQRLTDREVLEEYKGQSSVETRFRFLKQPLFVDGVFLKSPKRVEALGYVILLAVLVATFLERRIREALKEQGATIVAPGKRTLDRPTVTVLLNMLNTIDVVYLEHDTRMERHLPDNTCQEVLKLIRLCGYDERIYLEKPN